MTMQTEPQETPARRMTCTRRLYVMTDEAGRTWLAVEEPVSDASEGGVMSHRKLGDGPEQSDGATGGVMSHLVPGDTAEVEGDGLDQVTIVVPARPGGLPHRMQAYRVSPALLPSGGEPAAD